MTFSIADPDAPLAEIRGEALDAMREELDRAGFSQVGSMSVEVSHGERPTVTVHVMARPVVSADGISLRLVAA